MRLRAQLSSEFSILFGLMLLVAIVVIALGIMWPSFLSSVELQASNKYWPSAKPFSVESNVIFPNRLFFIIKNNDNIPLTITGVELDSQLMRFNQMMSFNNDSIPFSWNSTDLCVDELEDCSLRLMPGEKLILATDNFTDVPKNPCLDNGVFAPGRIYKLPLAISYHGADIGAGELQRGTMPLVGTCIYSQAGLFDWTGGFPEINITTESLPNVTREDNYSTIVEAVGGVPPLEWVEKRLFTGVYLYRNGSISGVANAQPGPTNFSVTVRDVFGQSATRDFSINIIDPATVVESIDGCQVLDQSRRYNLTKEAVAAPHQSCFIVTANDVTLDCNGHRVLGNGTLDAYGFGTYGVVTTMNNTRVINCDISGFYNAVSMNQSSNGQLITVRASSPSDGADAIALHSSVRNSFTEVYADSITGHAVSLSSLSNFNELMDVQASSVNESAILLSASSRNTLSYITANSSGSSTLVMTDGSESNSVFGLSAAPATHGVWLSNGTNNTIDCDWNQQIGSPSIVGPGTLGIYSSQNQTKISNCMIKDFSSNIKFENAENSFAANNVLTDELADSNGIVLHNSSGIMIENNSIDTHFGTGIHLLNSHNNTIISSRSYSAFSNGIWFENSPNNQIVSSSGSSEGFSYNCVPSECNYSIKISNSPNTVIFNSSSVSSSKFASYSYMSDSPNSRILESTIDYLQIFSSPDIQMNSTTMESMVLIFDSPNPVFFSSSGGIYAINCSNTSILSSTNNFTYYTLRDSPNSKIVSSIAIGNYGGIGLYNSSNSTILNCTTYGSYGFGQITSSQNSNITILNSQSNGTTITSSSNIAILDSVSKKYTGDCVHISGADGIEIRNLTIGTNIGGGNRNINVINSRNMRFSGVSFLPNSTGYFMVLTNNTNVTLANINVTSEGHIGIYATGLGYIDMEWAQDHVFDNCSVRSGNPLYLAYLNHATVKNSEFQSSAIRGTGLIAGRVSDLTISNTKAMGERIGMGLYHVINSTITNSTGISTDISHNPDPYAVTCTGIYLDNSSKNTIINSSSISSDKYSFFFTRGSNNNTVIDSSAISGQNPNGHSVGLLFWNSGNNTFTNGIIESKGIFGALVIWNYSHNNTISNNYINGKTGANAILVRTGQNKYNRIVNNTIMNATNLVNFFNTGTTKNTLYWNNFTGNPTRYVYDVGGGNFYNTTINGQPEGNIWHNIMNGSVVVSGSQQSLYGQGLAVGSSGAGYPYNNTTSLGKFVCSFDGCADFAPLVNE